MKTYDLGMDIEKILVVNGPRVILETQRPALGTLHKTFKTEVLRHHSISAISGTSNVPGKGYMWSGGIRKLGEPENAYKIGNAVFVNADFTNTYDMEFLASGKFPDEIPPYEWVIINEESVKVFGLGSPDEALNEELISFGDTLKILGVVQNVHWRSLKDAHSPILFVIDKRDGAYFSIKMKLSDIQESIEHIESAYKSVFPNDPFHYFFLDDSFNQQYQSDLQFGNLFTAFSILAIFIACLGLFALVSYSATLRIKEIGIRKVFGASIGNLMMLLSREYLILLFIAVALAVPAIIIGGKSWLENYAYQVGMGVDLFLIPGLILIIISFLTVSYRTYASARANPAASLRTE